MGKINKQGTLAREELGQGKYCSWRGEEEEVEADEVQEPGGRREGLWLRESYQIVAMVTTSPPKLLWGRIACDATPERQFCCPILLVT